MLSFSYRGLWFGNMKIQRGHIHFNAYRKSKLVTTLLSILNVEAKPTSLNYAQIVLTNSISLPRHHRRHHQIFRQIVEGMPSITQSVICALWARNDQNEVCSIYVNPTSMSQFVPVVPIFRNIILKVEGQPPPHVTKLLLTDLKSSEKI